VIRSKFHPERPQILGTTVKYSRHGYQALGIGVPLTCSVTW